MTRFTGRHWPRLFRAVAVILAIGAGTVFVSGAAEIYYRCCAPPLAVARNIHPDPSLGWDSIPAISPLEGNTGTVPAVYFAGDSFTQDRRWPLAAQREAARLGVRFDGYVIGVSGFGTTQEWLKVERHFQEHRPALVLLQFFAWNDLRDNVAYPPIAYSPTVFTRPFLVGREGRYTLVTPPAPSWPIRTVTATHIWRRVFFKVAVHADDQLARIGLDTLARWRFAGPVNYTERATWEPFYRPDVPDSDYVETAYGVTRESFRRLRTFLDQRNARLLVVGLDNPFTVDDDVKAVWISRGVPIDLGLPLARVAAMLRKDGIPFVDARPSLIALARQSGKKVYNPPAGELSGHLEPEGEEQFGLVAARAMAPILSDNGRR